MSRGKDKKERDERIKRESQLTQSCVCARERFFLKAHHLLVSLLHKKKIAFQMGKSHTVREIIKMVRAEIKKDRLNFKDKVEDQLDGKNLRAAWQGIK